MQGETRWSVLPFFCHVAFVTVKSACHVHSRWRADCRPHRRSGQPDIGQDLALASSSVPALRQSVRRADASPAPGQFLRHDPGFLCAWSKHFHELWVEQWLTEQQRMQPVAAAETWAVPVIESPGALADWLGLRTVELQWFADLKGLGYKSSRPKLRHYHYRILAKQSGNIRLIEAPKPRLKELQRQILAQILERIPPHPAVHGFVKGRSIKTFVAPHVGQRVVLRMDLRDFFPSFSAARIQAIFRTLGYPESVADLLGGICTNATPRDVWSRPAFDIDLSQVQEARALYSRPHLPQGAPAW